jgi:integrase
VELASFIQNAYLPTRVGVAETYAKNLAATAARFSRWLGYPASLENLTTQAIGSYLTDYSRKWSARSTNDQRQILLMLWKAAYRHGLVSLPPQPDLIRQMPEELDPPQAWSDDQVPALMQRAAKEPGYVGDVLAGDWWLSLFDTIYWTSFRIGSMLAVPSQAYEADGILVRKQKNHRPQWFPLPASCREVIERTRPATRRLIWQHPWNPRTVWAKARRIIEEAGLPAPKTGRQLFHRLRRTTITLCAAVDPAVAQRTAGHTDYATTLKHYVDPRLVHGRTVADILPDPLATRPLYESQSPRFRIYG